LGLPLSSKGISVAILMATLASSALFLAQGTTSLVAGKLFPFAAPAAAKAEGGAKKPPGTDPPDFHAILARNAFDSETGSLWPPKQPVTATPVDGEPAGAAQDPEEVIEGQMPPGCDSAVRLVATLFSERTPEWSIATLAAGSEAPLLFRKGSKVSDREVAAIFPRAVYLRQSNGKLCSLTLFSPPPTASTAPAAVAAAPAEATPPATSTGALAENDLDQNITKVSDTQFTVQRSFVDNLLMNQAEIMRSARVVPHEENGQVVGVKLYGIRRNSLLGKLGMQNGDLLKTINGFDMASPDSALEAYAKLRSAGNISVAVTRRGQPVGLEYQIQ
jgi:general secretion pathway protein C